ncbi:copper resistance protein CopC [Microbispora sp. H11081]|uniref:copper resistance CopC family protein n=1 Tax=Microbispora sp. H11081 TaxID=2729107 RepID=UPI002016702D|nr:copper resistance protein CopC [Microbispora sp. H11081]
MARWLGRLLLPVVFGVVAVAALAAPASAHGQLAMSTPAKDGTVREPLESLALYFTEAPAPNAYFTVTAPGGVRVDQPWAHGRPKRLDKPVQEYNLVDGSWVPSVYNTGYPAEIPVAYWPKRGEYVVRYLSIASDGEPVQGELRFTYKGKTSGPPKGWRAPDNEPDPGLLASAEHGGDAPNPAPQSGGPVTMGPAAPQAGDGQTTAPPTGTAAAGNAQPADSGSGLSAWLVPAVLVVGAGVLVARAARRRPAPATPAPAAPAARRSSGHSRSKTPSRGPASRTQNRPKSAKRR